MRYVPPAKADKVSVSPVSEPRLWKDVRGRVRLALTAHPGWPAYRALHALRMEKMGGRTAYEGPCAALGIDINKL